MKISTIQGQDLVIGNVGDSRAVLAMRNKDNSLVPIQLTVDLKPDLPSLFLPLSIYLSLSLSHAHGRVSMCMSLYENPMC